MESFSSQWLESIGRKKFAPLFTSQGYSSFTKCSQLTEQDLDLIGVTNDDSRKYLLQWARDLKGRDEEEVRQELPVSALHTELSVHRLLQYIPLQTWYRHLVRGCAMQCIIQATPSPLALDMLSSSVQAR